MSCEGGGGSGGGGERLSAVVARRRRSNGASTGGRAAPPREAVLVSLWTPPELQFLICSSHGGGVNEWMLRHIRSSEVRSVRSTLVEPSPGRLAGRHRPLCIGGPSRVSTPQNSRLRWSRRGFLRGISHRLFPRLDVAPSLPASPQPHGSIGHAPPRQRRRNHRRRGSNVVFPAPGGRRCRHFYPSLRARHVPRGWRLMQANDGGKKSRIQTGELCLRLPFTPDTYGPACSSSNARSNAAAWSKKTKWPDTAPRPPSPDPLVAGSAGTTVTVRSDFDRRPSASHLGFGDVTLCRALRAEAHAATPWSGDIQSCSP